MRKYSPRAWWLTACGFAALLVLAGGCGGGGGGPEEPPPPPALVITTTTLPDGVVGTAYSQTVNANGGTGARTFSITLGTLPAGLGIDGSTGVISGTPTGPAGTANITVQVVDSGSPQQTDTQALTIDVNPPLVITTTTLPDAAIGSPYNATVVATGGSGALTFTISSGSAPAGITMNAAGVFSGAATAGATTQNFTVRVADGSSPQQVDTQPLTINILAATGRNDTIATATTLTNGTFNASISPMVDPAGSGTLDPDIDVYRLTATAGAIVTVDINAQVNGSPIDSVIEIVDANGVQLNVCSASTGAPYTQPCENDDQVLGVQLDSFLEMQVGAVTTFFVRVVDFRGDARPDLLYQIVITGAN